MAKKKYKIDMPKHVPLFKKGDIRVPFVQTVSSLSNVSLRAARKAFDKELIELDPDDEDFAHLVKALHNICKVTLIDIEYPEPINLQEINEEHNAYT